MSRIVIKAIISRVLRQGKVLAIGALRTMYR